MKTNSIIALILSISLFGLFGCADKYEVDYEAMFWVISTAFVLQGVIISRRGPTKQPFRFSSLSITASPKSQQSLLLSSGVS